MRPTLVVIIWCCAASCLAGAAWGEETLSLQMRRRVETSPGSGEYRAAIEPSSWRPEQTAIVICDMWDDHYCRASARRVAEMAPRMNQVINEARRKGVLIIHCPSGCMDQYNGTPQRELARQAPKVETKPPLEAWCYLDKTREPELPVDESQPCDDETPRERIRFFTRQHEAIKIEPGDAVTDGAEAFYLMRQREITNVIVMGVHTNMCVLGRPFGIRQMVRQGQSVVLMRDMTDSMYDPRSRPFVSHFDGTRLIIQHIEKHWCPTISSADILGGEEFRFAGDEAAE
jgi:nicotinamidase-related amidase